MVSIIIPNYNHAAYLQQRIDSILNQTYKDFEILLLDDCSTDNSIQIINQYKNHQKIKSIIVNNKNSGNTFKQWDKGVALAKGEYIWIAESDDYADQNFLETAMQALGSQPQAGLFFCNNKVIDAAGNITGNSDHYAEKFIEYFSENAYMNGKLFCEQFMFFSNYIINASAVVFKKELYINADKGYRDFIICGDWRIWVDICYSSSLIVYNKKTLNYYRYHAVTVRSKNKAVYGAEVIRNYIYFLGITSIKKIKNELRNNICKMWVYSVGVNKNIKFNARLLLKVMAADGRFPLRLSARIIKKFTAKH